MKYRLPIFLSIIFLFSLFWGCEKEINPFDIFVNQSPTIPTTPMPANNATNVSTAPTLSWICSDPENDPLTYDVYFGTDNPPATKVRSSQRATSLGWIGLNINTAYYWKVIAKDNESNSTTGTVWKFTTGA